MKSLNSQKLKKIEQERDSPTKLLNNKGYFYSGKKKKALGFENK